MNSQEAALLAELQAEMQGRIDRVICLRTQGAAIARSDPRGSRILLARADEQESDVLELLRIIRRHGMPL